MSCGHHYIEAMKQPKRLHFTPSARQRTKCDEMLAAFQMTTAALRPVLQAASNMIGQMQRVVSATAAFGAYVFNSQGFKEGLAQTMLFHASWQQTELAPLLEQNNITHGLR